MQQTLAFQIGWFFGGNQFKIFKNYFSEISFRTKFVVSGELGDSKTFSMIQKNMVNDQKGTQR